MKTIRRAWSLRFESRADEAAFAHARAPERLTHFELSGWFSLLFYNSFLVVDWMLGPAVLETAAWLRLGGFTPVAVAMLLFVRLARQRVLQWPPGVIEGVVAMTAPMAALSLGGVLWLSPEVAQSAWSGYYHAGFVPILVYGNVVQRIRFRHALWSTLAVLAIHWVCAFHSAAFPAPILIPMLVFISVMAVYTLITNYRLELEDRQRYLQDRRAQALRQELHIKRQQLEMLAQRDPLTGLLNRRAMDIALARGTANWHEHGVPLSGMLIDVDHFKAFNDRYGHPAGDECLRHVAHALNSALSGTTAVIGRWGGEEFMVLIEGANREMAQILAERLRATVQQANLRHEGSSCGARVTVSVGVSTLDASDSASAHPSAAADLVAQADTALYQAKRLGRNRVHIHEVERAGAVAI